MAASPNAILDAILASLRSYSSGALQNTEFRKGPQQSLFISDGTDSVGIVTLLGLVRGEQPMGSGGAFAHNWEFAVLLLVPDEPETASGAQTSEERRLQLVEDVKNWLDANRAVGGVQIARGASLDCGIAQEGSNLQQAWRYARWTLQTKDYQS